MPGNKQIKKKIIKEKRVSVKWSFKRKTKSIIADWIHLWMHVNNCPLKYIHNIIINISIQNCGIPC